MTTYILNGDGGIAMKKIKLDKDYLVSNKEIESNKKGTFVKLEPNITNDYLSTDDRPKEMKVYPMLNLSEDSKNHQKSVPYYVSDFKNSCTKEDYVQLNINDSNRSERSNQDNPSHIRPSEALFVRCLLPHCKRLAPLWFKGVSSMREKNREDHRRISASTTCQNQNDWERISNLINEMNESSESETVVNLLKKLYKELPSDSVLWFIKCWLKFPDTLAKEDKCALSRGDARGRMRRIDGGKGSDKVWRLDTIVGMMFHGMPMSSTDTNIMIHTCDKELCIRPQHLRFRASSVAFVAVLKALQQTGYSIIPPADDVYSVRGSASPCDEFVDVSGPFKIEQLQQYRLEDLKPYEKSMGKLNSSSSDTSLLEMYPILKNYYPSYGNDFQVIMNDYKSRRNTCGKSVHPENNIKRPAKTSSNSTGSPPQINEGMNHQCHSPPNLTSVKSLNTEIAPTPRKFEVLNSNRVGTFKISGDSPLSSQIFSNGREKDTFSNAPDLMAEEPYDTRPSISNDALSNTSRVTNESPIISGSNNGSGKTTPRQPAKKRLEARTPTFLNDDQQDTFSSVSSPLDNKLGNSSNSMSAFRVVPKKNIISNDVKPCDELIEVEVAKIFDPCSSFQNGHYHPDGPFLSDINDVDGKCLSNGTISELDLLGNRSSNNKANESLTTPSPFDYLFMAISQNQSNSVLNDRASLLDNGNCSPALDGHKTSLLSNDSSMRYRMPLKASSNSLSCRFTPEQASVLLNVIRNSPYGNNNPEIVDILFNMMQQYPCISDSVHGDHCYRPDSRVLRRQIYQQLSKASPQLDNCSHTPILSEILNDESVTLTRSSPFQNQLNKIIFNPPSSTPKNNKVYFAEN